MRDRLFVRGKLAADLEHFSTSTELISSGTIYMMELVLIRLAKLSERVGLMAEIKSRRQT